MTEDQFQREVHDYQTMVREVVIADRDRYQAQGVDCVAVDFGRLGYGLMLRGAAEMTGQPTVE